MILSDDLEMKAVSAQYAVPDAAVDAIRAGCDGVLICSGDVDLQARTLEALVKAVESGQDSGEAHRRCVRAAEAGEAAVPDRRAAGADGAHHARCAASSAAKNISWSPPRWRRICDTLSEVEGFDCAGCIRRSRRARRAGQLVSAGGGRGRRRRAGAARARGGLRPVDLRQGPLRRRLRRDARARDSQRVGRSVDRGADRHARRLRQRAAACRLLDPRLAAIGAQGADRLQRHHGAADAVPAAMA